jgi:hypothetical protein
MQAKTKTYWPPIKIERELVSSKDFYGSSGTTLQLSNRKALEVDSTDCDKEEKEQTNEKKKKNNKTKPNK